MLAACNSWKLTGSLISRWNPLSDSSGCTSGLLFKLWDTTRPEETLKESFQSQGKKKGVIKDQRRICCTRKSWLMTKLLKRRQKSWRVPTRAHSDWDTVSDFTGARGPPPRKQPTAVRRSSRQPGARSRLCQHPPAHHHHQVGQAAGHTLGARWTGAERGPQGCGSSSSAPGSARTLPHGAEMHAQVPAPLTASFYKDGQLSLNRAGVPPTRLPAPGSPKRSWSWLQPAQSAADSGHTTAELGGCGCTPVSASRSSAAPSSPQAGPRRDSQHGGDPQGERIWPFKATRVCLKLGRSTEQCLREMFCPVISLGIKSDLLRVKAPHKLNKQPT